MLAWIIVLAVLLLLLMLPIGADAAFGDDGFSLELKLGPLRRQLLPSQKPKAKNAKKKKRRDASVSADEKKPKRKMKLTLDDILELLHIALKTLDRFRLHLSVDLFQLHWIAGAEDPYDAVLQFGRVNEALGLLRPSAHRVLNVRRDDLLTELDFAADRPKISGRIILSIQIWEIILLALCAGGSAAGWYIRKRRLQRIDCAGILRKEQA